MRIIKHFNPHFPERETYKCTTRYTTKFGTLDEVNQWRDDQLKNETITSRLKNQIPKAAGEIL